jgi:hypothetical protein
MRIVVLLLAMIPLSACSTDTAGPRGETLVAASITFDALPASVVPNEERSISAIVKSANGTVIPGAAVQWSTSGAGVASISATGVLKGLAPGSARITASSGSATSSFDITVDQGGFVGAAGGTITAFNGGVVLAVPAGALSTGTAIRLGAISSPPPDPTFVRGSGGAVTFSGTFAVPARLTLTYDPAEMPAGLPEPRLGLRTLSNNAWTSIAGSTVDAGANSVSASITTAGSYGVGMRPSEAACTAAEHRQFDFLLGTFGWAGPSNLAGEAEIVADAQGCVLRETLRIPNVVEVRAVLFYEPASMQWHYTSVDGSTVTRLSGGREDARMVLYSANRQRRVVWETLSAQSYRQAGESLSGTAWTRQAEGVYTRKNVSVPDNVITPAGGKIVLANGAVTLEAPAGAVTQNVAVTVTVAATGGPGDPAIVRGAVYTLSSTPAVTFQQPVKLTLAYDPTKGPGGVQESQFGIAASNGIEWKTVPNTSVDATANTSIASITTLGMFTTRRVEPTTPCVGDKYRQFDFWLGDWDVGGTIHSSITAEPGGCAIYELYRVAIPGKSISVYDPVTDMWYQTYLGGGVSVLPMSGGIENGKMVMYVLDPAGARSQRWTWTPVDANTVTQKAETPAGNEVTWTQVFFGTYRRR